MKAIAKVWVLVAAIGLLTGPAAQAAAPDKYMPDSTELVFSINVRAILESGVTKKHFEKELNDFLQKGEVAQILNALGLDPKKDISEVLICAGKVEVDIGGQPPIKGEALMIVRGNYNLDKMHSTLAEGIKGDPNKLAVSDYSGVKVYEGKGDNADQTFYFTLLDNKTIATSNKKSAVTDAIDKNKGKSTSKISKPMATMLDKADGKRTIWLALVLPGAVKDLAKISPQGEIVEKIDGLTIGATITDSIRAEFKVHTNDEGAAATLRAGVEGGKGLLAVQVLQNKELGPLVTPIINSIKVAADSGKTVTINMEVDAATIEKLAKKAKEQ